MTIQPSQPELQPAPEKPRDSGSFQWIAAVVLILLGVIFLLQQTGAIVLGDNWWVVFLLLPAAGLFYDAWQRYQAGAMHRAWGQVLGGVILIVIALTFFFNWNWDMIWPVFLIVGGVYLLLQRRR
jgi:cation transport ATPase